MRELKQLVQIDPNWVRELENKVVGRYVRKNYYCGTYRFWEEIKELTDERELLQLIDKSLRYKWIQKPKEGIVLGEVWECEIGVFLYKRRVHIFTLLYVENDGLAIGEHGHYELCQDKKTKKPVKEWYIFPDGRVIFCGNNERHSLENSYANRDGEFWQYFARILRPYWQNSPSLLAEH